MTPGLAESIPVGEGVTKEPPRLVAAKLMGEAASWAAKAIPEGKLLLKPKPG